MARPPKQPARQARPVASGLGFGEERIKGDALHFTSTCLAGFDMAANVVAVHRFLRNHRALSRGEPVDPSSAGPAALAVFAALLGAVLVLLLGGALLS